MAPKWLISMFLDAVQFEVHRKRSAFGLSRSHSLHSLTLIAHLPAQTLLLIWDFFFSCGGDLALVFVTCSVLACVASEYEKV